MNRFLPLEPSAKLLRHLQQAAVPLTYTYERHRLTLPLGEQELSFRLPLPLPYPSKPGEKAQVNYVILLVQSGNCAMGYFENGRNLDHKVWRSYMVRKKQGKSQIKHLKTKGKSRAGSRVRLGETLEFFENINGRLQEYFEEHTIHRIAISCSKILIPYLFGSKVATPFAKDDPRLYRIPRHVHTPIYEVLLDTNRFLQRGELIFEEAQQPLVDKLLSEAGITGESIEVEAAAAPETDWDEVYFDDEDEDDEMEW